MSIDRIKKKLFMNNNYKNIVISIVLFCTSVKSPKIIKYKTILCISKKILQNPREEIYSPYRPVNTQLMLKILCISKH